MTGSIVLFCVTAFSLVNSLGCGSDTTLPVAPVAAKQYWQLVLDHHAITLALTPPYNQFRLMATPLTVTGAPLTTEAKVRFTSSDTSVQVDSTGLLTAHSVRTGVAVIATLTVGGLDGLTLADTAWVNVNAVTAVPVFATLTVHSPGDSARIAYISSGPASQLDIRILDSDDKDIPGARHYISSMDSRIVSSGETGPSVSNGQISGIALGTTKLVVEATVYGISKSDTLSMTVGQPSFGTVALDSISTTLAAFSPAITIGPGGVVEFVNRTGISVDILFDDSTAVLGTTAVEIDYLKYFFCVFNAVCPTETMAGNIHALQTADTLFTHRVGIDFRKFPAVGTYTFHTIPFNAIGKIFVVR
jgi:hypothetical protein